MGHGSVLGNEPRKVAKDSWLRLSQAYQSLNMDILFHPKCMQRSYLVLTNLNSQISF